MANAVTGAALGGGTNKGGTDVPAPPGISAEERALIEKQGLTLDRVVELIDKGDAQNEQLNTLLKGFSGFYKDETTTTPAGEKLSLAKSSSGKNVLDNAIAGVGIARNEVDLLGHFGATAEEQKGAVDRLLGEGKFNQFLGAKGGHALVSARQELLNALKGLKEEGADLSALKGSTFGGETLVAREEVPESSVTNQVLDKDAVALFRQRAQDTIDFDETVRQQGQETLSNVLQGINDKTPLDIKREEIALIEADRTKRALEGRGEVSAGLREEGQRQFSLLKENLARTGNAIQGNDLDTAVGLTTPAIQALDRLKTQFGLRADAEQRSDLAQTTGFGLQRQGLQSDITGQNFGLGLQASQLPGQNRSLSLLTGQGSPLAGVQGLLGASQGYGGMMSLFGNQRLLHNQANLQTAVNNAQARSDLYGLIGTAGGIGAGLALASSKAYKKKMKKVTEREEDSLLSKTAKTPIHRWKYKDEGDETATHTGVLTENAPDTVVTKDGKKLDVASYFGLLTSNVKALNRKVTKLESSLRSKKEAV